MQSHNSDKLDRILAAVDQCRALSLDAIEQELCTSPRWRFLRSRLLKLWGHRGLESQIRNVILEQDHTGGDDRESYHLR